MKAKLKKAKEKEVIKKELNSSYKKIKSVFIGISTATVFYLVFGMFTVLIKNPFFNRMTPVHWYDFIFLILTALLLGTYAGLYYYNKGKNEILNKKSNYAASIGAIGGVFSFGCASCNMLLVFMLGVNGAIAIQPILGVISAALLGCAVLIQLKTVKWKIMQK